MVKVVRDREEDIIKVIDSPDAKVSGKFGTSLLYEYGHYYFHPRAFEVLSKIDRIKYRNDDVILTMFPKSGSTWLSECIYLIMNNYRYDLASSDSIELRFPQIDSPSHDVFDMILSQYDDTSRVRMIKSSIPPNLLVTEHHKVAASGDPTLGEPKQQASSGNSSGKLRPRVISIFRNPRDILVSFYHHCKTVKHYDLSFNFEQFFDAFVSGQVPCGPIWQTFNDTIKYHRENPESTLIIYYEDMKRDLRGQIERMCKFLAKPEPLDENHWAQLMDHLSVDKMRKNQTINRHDWTQLGLRNPNGYEFVRKGQVNDWKNFFSRQQSELFDREITQKFVGELKAIYGPKEY